MNELTATIILLGLFIVRFFVPLGIVLGLRVILNRLYAYWGVADEELIWRSASY